MRSVRTSYRTRCTNRRGSLGRTAACYGGPAELSSRRNPSEKNAEIARLWALVEQQDQKMRLLEEKVRLLEAELKKAKESKK